MSVRKRYKEDGSFVWEFCITIQKKPRKQYRKSGFKKRDEAVKAEQEAITKFRNGCNLTLETTTFQDLALMFLEKSKSKSKSIQRNYNNSYKNHLQYFYKFKLTDITTLIVEKWVIDCNKTPATIAECIKFAKAVYNYGIKHSIVTRNPFVKVERPKVENKDRNRLTTKEALEMLRLCKNRFPDLYPILATIIFTGVRVGELLALKWKDFDFKNGKVKIQRQYTQRELKDTLKTSSSYRTVDVCPTLVRILKEHRTKQTILSEFVFINQKGNLYNRDYLVEKKFKPLLKEMFGDRNYMRFYDLRGTYVDILLAEGVPLKYIQSQVGHSNFLTTMNNYSKLIKDVNEHAVNVLEQTVSIL